METASDCEYCIYCRKLVRDLEGGPGSGNWGHVGRPGERGGSGGGGLPADRPNGNTEQLSAESKAAVIAYTGQGGADNYEVNGALIHAKGNIDAIKNEATREKIAKLDKSMEEGVLKEGVVYRGVHGKEFRDIYRLNEGEIYEDHGYKSTSLDQRHAAHFTQNKQEDLAFLIIKYPDGTHGVSLGNTDREKEVVLDRGKTYRVGKRINMNIFGKDTQVITVEVLPTKRN